ncbi:MAG: lysylphosphatidylglycerol synthase transmembrane domain-containing protein [Sumerlaeia bacterium]
MKKHRKKLLSLLVSATLLGLLISSVDRGALLQVIGGANLWWFALALAMFIPQTLAIAHRWSLIVEPIAPISEREAGRQVLASSCLNLVLPSKLGDLAKGVFLYRQGRCRFEDGLQIVVFEKLLDLAALSGLMVIGWLIAPRSDWWVLATLGLGLVVMGAVWTIYFVKRGGSVVEGVLPGFVTKHPKFGKLDGLLKAGPRVMALIHGDARRKWSIVAWSFTIWLLHLAQIAFFFFCLRADAGFFEVLARVPIAIFAGLLPLAIAGVGVRDWAIVAIFGSATNPRAVLVGVGLLVSLRYVIPAAAGLLFFNRYLGAAREAQEKLSDSPSKEPT